MSEKKKIKLSGFRESWENLFSVMNNRKEPIKRMDGSSLGNFWAFLQHLEWQFKCIPCPVTEKPCPFDEETDEISIRDAIEIENEELKKEIKLYKEAEGVCDACGKKREYYLKVVKNE